MPQVPYTDDLYKLPDRVSAGGSEVLNVPNYGAIIGRGLEQFGQGAGAVEGMATRMKQQDDVTAVQSAMNDLRDHGRNVQYGDPNTPDDRGFFGLQDKAALDAWKPTADGFQQYQKNLMGTLTADQQRLFSQESEPFMAGALNSLAGHANSQRDAYQKKTQQATLINLTNQGTANMDNPAAFAGSLLQGRKAIQQQMALQGVPLDGPIAQQQLQQFNDKYLTTAAGAAVDSGDAIKGRNLLLSNRGNLSAPAFEQAMAELKPHLDHQEGQMLADGVINHNSAGQPIPSNADQAATFTAMTHIESGGQQMGKDGKPLTSPKGAVGISQMLPGTAEEVAKSTGLGWDENRFQHDQAYNHALGEAFYSQLCQKYGGNQTLACAAYNAGPGKVDEWVKQIGDPRTGAITDEQFAQHIPYKETRNYVGHAGAILTKSQPVASYAPPDIGSQILTIQNIAKAKGFSPEAERYAVGLARSSFSDWEDTTKYARNQLHNQLGDLSSAYMAGNTKQDIPEAQIRSLYQPEEAQQKIDELNIRRNAGITFSSMKWASPQQVEQYRQDAMAQRSGEDIDHFKLRQQGAAMVMNGIKQRNEALQKDPAAYVQDNPQVQQAWQTYQQNQTPENLQAYGDRMRSLQQTMGLVTPRVLTNQQAASIVSKLSRLDVTKEGQDAGPVLDGLRQQYGEKLWPSVLSELVANKMPPALAVMANMDNPSQAVARETLQRNMQLKNDDLVRAAGADAKQLEATASNDPIARQLDDFRHTTALQQGGMTGYDNVYNVMKTQTLGYMAKGLSLNASLKQAREDLVDLKYDTSGYLRTPKGEMGITKAAGQQFLMALGEKDITPFNLPGVDAENRAFQSLHNARFNGQWITNGDETGYNLLIPSTRPGEWQMLLGADRKPITLSRADIRSGRYISPNDEIAQRDLQLVREGKHRYVARPGFSFQPTDQ